MLPTRSWSIMKLHYAILRLDRIIGRADRRAKDVEETPWLCNDLT
jgi:hypothetical protein